MRHLDPCPTCHTGTMRKYCTKTKGRNRSRYLKCDQCDEHGQEVFRVDALGRPLLSTSFTPLGNSEMDHQVCMPTMNRPDQQSQPNVQQG